MLRRQIIDKFTAAPTENAADAAIDLWKKMATQIVSISGEGGFNSLYARSISLTQSRLPSLRANPPSAQTAERFAELKQCFSGQTSAQICAANNLLLTAFTDILAALIGEMLTTRILRSAWEINPPDKTDTTLLPAHPKELKNE